MNEQDQNTNPLSKINPAAMAGVAGMIGESFLKDYSQEVMPLNSSGRVDIAQVANQEYAKSPFAFGDIAQGAAAGATLGPWGALAGAGVGLGTAIVKMARENKAKKEFERHRSENVLAGNIRNKNIDFRERVFNNFGNSRYKQYIDFYGG